MPEGHTLRKLADDLTAAFAGRRVRVTSPQGRFAADAALLDGSRVIGADSAGKHLFLELEGERFVHVHLGLIGQLDVHADIGGGLGAVPDPVGAVRLRLVTLPDADAGAESGAGPRPPAYADLRGAIVCDLVGPARRAEVIERLGPDPLRPDADPDRAWRRISASQRPIGDLLMDQKVLAGVGNVYRAEVLFRHRIHPLRPGNTLRVGQWRAMWDDLVELMAEGVRTGRIDTVRPEHTPEAMGREPRKDDHGGEVYVYRRTSLPCLVCGTPVLTGELVGRNTFWCPRCQPKFRSRALRSPTKGTGRSGGARR
ncbi:Fpg/Nei family DNA glycosylase [Nocardioides sp. zg-1228]|uniref:Fpg/Nei family DNA glycosylase n=1 Tax=Nocardioides sp. zg-1228 TaxID=2763008 RepID=UPI0016434DE6|nr:Fpg/Nei family DNA glycosylase [Nocardioides sp. zg-1228]MBC2933193.1 Fpg/Nei family DNA glycosylase [Nocardioides sp. zg-1228]QSF56634.1 Fpg/Nei family DNA glycosylase [Nocardioides sp. zg-1228]